MSVKFSISDNQTTQEGYGFSLVDFEIDGDVLAPEDLKEINLKLPDESGVVLSGRGPVWLYAALVHHYHPVQWIATRDLRLGGAVVVSSHVKSPSSGDVVKF